MQEFSGRTAVITGGASGIGLGMARFCKRGMRLVLADLNEELLQAAEQEFSAAGVDVVSQICDASKLEWRLSAWPETAMDRFGGVHVVCSNAGVGIPRPQRVTSSCRMGSGLLMSTCGDRSMQ